MSLAPLYETLRRGDPDRFLALMAAPPAVRPRLLPLYAFNLEIARAPWASAEPMIAEMRLQWWRDVLDEIGQGRPARAHEVARPLAEVLRAAAIPPALLDGAVAARRRDLDPAPFADAAALESYLDATGGSLMWAAALALEAPAGAEAAVRGMARAGALAAWLRAVPALEARGRRPLPDGRPEAVARLARAGLGWIAAARAARGAVPRRVAPALLPAWQAGPVLARAAAEPGRVAAGALGLSEAGARARLVWQAASGRW
jgi:phytoene/squalene synthetase